MPKSKNNKRSINPSLSNIRSSVAPLVASHTKGLGQPDSTYVWLRTTNFAAWTISATTGVWFTLKLNSAFDPTGTLAATQPYAFDQWSALYNNYRVHRTKVSVQPVTPYTTGGLVILGHPSSNTTNENFVNSTGDPDAKYMLIPSTSGGDVSRKLQFDIPIRNWSGLTKEEFEGDPVYAAIVSQDPATILYLKLAVLSNGASISTSADVITTIEQYVQFYNRVDLDASLFKASMAIGKRLEKHEAFNFVLGDCTFSVNPMKYKPNTQLAQIDFEFV